MGLDQELDLLEKWVFQKLAAPEFRCKDAAAAAELLKKTEAEELLRKAGKADEEAEKLERGGESNKNRAKLKMKESMELRQQAAALIQQALRLKARLIKECKAKALLSGLKDKAMASVKGMLPQKSELTGAAKVREERRQQRQEAVEEMKKQALATLGEAAKSTLTRVELLRKAEEVGAAMKAAAEAKATTEEEAKKKSGKLLELKDKLEELMDYNTEFDIDRDVLVRPHSPTCGAAGFRPHACAAAPARLAKLQVLTAINSIASATDASDADAKGSDNAAGDAAAPAGGADAAKASAEAGAVERLKARVLGKREDLMARRVDALAKYDKLVKAAADGATSRRLEGTAEALRLLVARCNSLVGEKEEASELAGIARVALDAVRHAHVAYRALEALQEEVEVNMEKEASLQSDRGNKGEKPAGDAPAGDAPAQPQLAAGDAPVQLQPDAHRSVMLLTAVAKLRLTVANVCTQVVWLESRELALHGTQLSGRGGAGALWDKLQKSALWGKLEKLTGTSKTRRLGWPFPEASNRHERMTGWSMLGFLTKESVTDDEMARSTRGLLFRTDAPSLVAHAQRGGPRHGRAQAAVEERVLAWELKQVYGTDEAQDKAAKSADKGLTGEEWTFVHGHKAEGAFQLKQRRVAEEGLEVGDEGDASRAGEAGAPFPLPLVLLQPKQAERAEKLKRTVTRDQQLMTCSAALELLKHPKKDAAAHPMNDQAAEDCPVKMRLLERLLLWTGGVVANWATDVDALQAWADDVCKPFKGLPAAEATKEARPTVEAAAAADEAAAAAAVQDSASKEAAAKVANSVLWINAANAVPKYLREPKQLPEGLKDAQWRARAVEEAYDYMVDVLTEFAGPLVHAVVDKTAEELSARDPLKAKVREAEALNLLLLHGVRRAVKDAVEHKRVKAEKAVTLGAWVRGLWRRRTPTAADKAAPVTEVGDNHAMLLGYADYAARRLARAAVLDERLSCAEVLISLFDYANQLFYDAIEDAVQDDAEEVVRKQQQQLKELFRRPRGSSGAATAALALAAPAPAAEAEGAPSGEEATAASPPRIGAVGRTLSMMGVRLQPMLHVAVNKQVTEVGKANRRLKTARMVSKLVAGMDVEAEEEKSKTEKTSGGKGAEGDLKSALQGSSRVNHGEAALNAYQGLIAGALEALPEKSGKRELQAAAQIDAILGHLEEMLFQYEECIAVRRCGFLIGGYSTRCWRARERAASSLPRCSARLSAQRPRAGGSRSTSSFAA